MTSGENLCPFEDCTRPVGHSGAHGYALEGGIILAPYGGGEGDISSPELAPLQCDCCGALMFLSRFSKGGGRFACSSCEQIWNFSPDGNFSHTVIASLYPSEMKEDSKIYDEYLSYRLREISFTIAAQILCGLLTAEEGEREFGEFRRAVEVKREEIANKRMEEHEEASWWKFWQEKKS